MDVTELDWSFTGTHFRGHKVINSGDMNFWNWQIDCSGKKKKKKPPCWQKDKRLLENPDPDNPI